LNWFLLSGDVFLLNPYIFDSWGDYMSCRSSINWDESSSLFIDIILSTCIDMRLNMSKGLTCGDRTCWYISRVPHRSHTPNVFLRSIVNIWLRSYLHFEAYHAFPFRKVSKHSRFIKYANSQVNEFVDTYITICPA